jgi:Coenzyme PQQ synthesis protein D (PqqD)
VFLQISDAVIWQDAGEFVSLYHLDHGEFLTLNESGAKIWKLVDSEGDLDAVVAKLSMEYGGSSTAMSGRIRGEVRRFVDSMVKRGLLAEGQPA